MISFKEKTLASIVTEHSQSVNILEKYDLDFCCKGKRTLAQACMDQDLPVDNIAKELEGLVSFEENKHKPFAEMKAHELISYILLHHHFYVKQSMPTIIAHLEKVVAKHGERFPYMVKVFQLFSAIREEMTLHMQKEEMVLFPRIKEIENLFITSQRSKLAKGYINGPVSVMEMEHEHAGELLFEIRHLTNNYTPPVDACTTFKLSLSELKEFEQDLHRHVHLENNLLFPLSEKMLEVITA
jgi:regulator of cell morphogenesis and NO signaling